MPEAEVHIGAEGGLDLRFGAADRLPARSFPSLRRASLHRRYEPAENLRDRRPAERVPVREEVVEVGVRAAELRGQAAEVGRNPLVEEGEIGLDGALPRESLAPLHQRAPGAEAP